MANPLVKQPGVTQPAETSTPVANDDTANAGTSATGPQEIPLLQAGDYLTRAEFERRYQAYPETKKAELIEGIVNMPSPVRAKVHGDPRFAMVTWAGVYIASTPGLRGSDNATLRLDFVNEPQPDALLRLEPAFGGQSSIERFFHVSLIQVPRLLA